MYSLEQRKKAIETFFRFDRSYADTISELGYPNRHSLYNWVKDYERNGEVLPSKWTREPRYPAEKKRAAVDYYLEHGKSIARTIRAMGYPSKQALASWIDELAPDERRVRPNTQTRYYVSLEEKIQTVAELESRSGTAAEIAGRHNVSRTLPYIWRRQMLLEDNVPAEESSYHRRRPVSKEYNELPDDLDELRSMLETTKTELRRVQLELDVRTATLEIIKKDPGTDPNRLTNREKAILVNSLRGTWKLRELLEAMDMAKSSYEYAANALIRPESEEDRRIREAVAVAFGRNGGTYGYRRILAELGETPDLPAVSEWKVRKSMRSQGLCACNPKRKRKYSSYVGEVSAAPENTCLNEDGTHDFSADGPNELWITDITEFRIPAGKCYLSPILDCYDGMPISWSIGTSPNAKLANSSLIEACSQLKPDERPRLHSDRGGHYRWPEWVGICEEHGIKRSMSRKGHSPDNSRAEGFFGRLKVEFFYDRDWSNVTMDEFMSMLDGYMVWYRDERRKSDLGYMSPMRYRQNLGLTA